MKELFTMAAAAVLLVFMTCIGLLLASLPYAIAIFIAVYAIRSCT